MSKEFIRNFFPAVTKLLEPLPTTQFFFPDNLGCDEVIWRFHSVDTQVRNPVLCSTVLAGIMIGFDGYRRHWSISSSLSVSFLYFGLMNVVALPLHCFLQQENHFRANEMSTWLWLFDCLYTGVSSQYILWGVTELYLENSELFEIPEPLTKLLKLQTPMTTNGRIVLPLLGILCSLYFICFTNSPSRTLPLELFYLVPMLNTGNHVAFPLLSSQRNAEHRSYRFMVCFGSGVLVSIGGILLDAFFCRMLKGVFVDLLAAPTMMFIGCNLCFLGLTFWLTDTVQSYKASKRK